jgi:two-component system, OmpR family, sensor kinase
MSLRLRLLVAFAYVALLILVALELPLALNLSRRIDAEVKDDAASQAFVVAAGASGRMNNLEELRKLVRDAATQLGARVIVVDARGLLKADSAGAVAPRTSYRSRPEIRTALAGLRAQGRRHSQTLGEDLLYTAVPVTNFGRPVGAVRVTQNVDAVGHRIRRSILVLVAIGAFALLIGLVIAWFLAGSLSRPLRNLASTARRVEEGDLDARADLTGPKEHREVAIAFNDMTERLGRVLAAQREFVANASHQLRTPLTGLRLRIESARDRGGAEVEEDLSAAEVELERLSRLLTALLTLAREGGEAPAATPVSLADAAQRAEQRWRARADQRNQRLVLEGDGDAVADASDEDVAIVLDNLIENALHYSPSPSTVTLNWGETDGEAWLAVLDEGPGLEPGEEAALFDRFARGNAGRSAPGGTGLGLAIVQTLARRWRGRAMIENRTEGGMRAELRLPRRG